MAGMYFNIEIKGAQVHSYTFLVIAFNAWNFLKYLSPSVSYRLNSLTMSGQTYEYISLILLATSSDSSGGIEFSRSRSNCCTKYVISLPAMGMCFIAEPMTYPSAYPLTQSHNVHRTNDVTYNRDNMGNTISGVNDCSSKCLLCVFP